MANRTPMSPSGLEDLPTEVVNMILDSTKDDGTPTLCGSDLCNLRLANRQLQVISFECFAKRCFGTRKHMLDFRSLTTLNEIAQHPIFSDYVREVAIGPERINEDFLQSDCPDHDPSYWESKRRRDCCPLIVQQFVDLVWTQNGYEDCPEPLVGILGLALQRFENLAKVRLDSYMDLEDDDGRPRAWGARRYYELAADLEQAGYRRVHPNPDGVDMASIAVDDRDFRPPPHILVNRGHDVEGLYQHYTPVLEALRYIREREDWTLEFHYDFTPRRWPQSHDILNLMPLEVTSEIWDSVCRRVRVLNLAAVFEEYTEHQDHYEEWVSNLLESCDRVERLIITDNEDQWEALSDANHSPHLRSITIKRSRIPESELCELLNNHAEWLEELICEDIHLTLVSHLGWTHVLRELITKFPKLARIELSQLYQSEAPSLPVEEAEDINTVITASGAEAVRQQLDLAVQQSVVFQSVVFGNWQFGWTNTVVQEDRLVI